LSFAALPAALMAQWTAPTDEYVKYHLEVECVSIGFCHEILLEKC